MEYTGEGIEALVAAVDDIENASLIIADKKIRALLRCLAYYEELRTVIGGPGTSDRFAARMVELLKNRES